MKLFRCLPLLLVLTGCDGDAADATHNNPHYQLPLEKLFADACARRLAEDALASALADQGQSHPCIGKINYRGLDGLTPLFWPIRHQDMEAVRTMLRLGADADIQLSGRFSASSYVTYAVNTHDMELLKLLLEAGAEPTHHKDGGLWALYGAILNENYAALTLLLSTGVSPNAADSFSNTILQRSIFSGDYRGAYMLLEAGADPNVSNTVTGVKPIYRLEEVGCSAPTGQEVWCYKVVEFLRERHGIEIEVENFEGGRNPGDN